MIELRTLGPLDLRATDGRAVSSVLAQPRRLALLIYLTVARPLGFHRRDRLLTLFWGEQDQEHGRAALTRAIYFLRRALGEDVIVSRGDEIVVDRTKIWCDAVAFDDAVEESRHAEASLLYRGDLLPGFFISGGSEFEQWLELERACLRERAARSVAELSEAEEALGNLALAIQHARRASDLLPYDERLLRRVLLLLDRAGDRVGAMHAYERFAARSSEEFDLTPAPETRALVDAIRGRVAAGGQPQLLAANPWRAAEQSAAASPPSVAQGAPWSRRKAVWAVAMVALAVAVLFVAPLGREELDSQRVYVARIANPDRDPRLDQLGAHASDLLVQGLSQTGSTVAFPPSAARGLRDSNVDERIAAMFSSARRAQAGLVLSTVMHADRDTVRIHSQVYDTRRREVRWAIRPISAPINDATGALNELQQRTMGAIAILHDAHFASWFRHAGAPPTFEAYQEFAKGNELRFNGQPAAALEYFDHALALDPTFTWALMEKALAYMNELQTRSARPIVDSLNRRRDSLLPLQRHFLDWMVAFYQEDQLGAHEAMIEAAKLAPQRFLYSVGLTASWVNRPHTTIRALQQLAATPDFDGGHLGYWSFLTGSYHQVGQYKDELTAAREARQRHPEQVSALCFEIRALAVLGRKQDVDARLDTIYSFPPARGNTFGSVLLELAPELATHGMTEEAQEVYDRAVAWYRTRAPQDTLLLTYHWEFAQALFLGGYLDEAERQFRRAAALDTTQVDSYVFVGVIAARRGDTTAARKVLHELDLRRNSVGRPLEEVVQGKARILTALGDQESAIRLLIDAIGGQGQDLHADPNFAALRSNPRFREFIRPKG